MEMVRQLTNRRIDPLDPFQFVDSSENADVEFSQGYPLDDIVKVLEKTEEHYNTPTTRMSAEDAREFILHTIHMHTEDIELFIDFLLRSGRISP